MSKQRLMKNGLVVFLSLVLLLSSFSVALANQESDIQGHWAQQEIQKWVESGLIKGYPDGSFKPNNSITRAEFMTIVNRAFNFTEQSSTRYIDVPADAWYAQEVAKASAAGYITGYNDGSMKPNNQISRQEVATILSRIADLEEDASKANNFKDALLIPEWSIGYIGAVVAAGYMTGYPDGTFQPAKAITRAEAVVTLDRMLAEDEEKEPKEEEAEEPKEEKKPGSGPGGSGPGGGSGGTGGGGGGGGGTPTDIEKIDNGGTVNNDVVLDEAGKTYGHESKKATINGNITINGANIKLRNATVKGNVIVNGDKAELNNVTITGNLIITENVKNDFTANRVNVEGTTEVKGGSSNTVEFINTQLQDLSITKKGVRVVLEGDSGIIGNLVIEAEGMVLEISADSIIKRITVKSNDVTLKGSGSNLKDILIVVEDNVEPPKTEGDFPAPVSRSEVAKRQIEELLKEYAVIKIIDGSKIEISGSVQEIGNAFKGQGIEYITSNIKEIGLTNISIAGKPAISLSQSESDIIEAITKQFLLSSGSLTDDAWDLIGSKQVPVEFAVEGTSKTIKYTLEVLIFDLSVDRSSKKIVYRGTLTGDDAKDKIKENLAQIVELIDVLPVQSIVINNNVTIKIPIAENSPQDLFKIYDDLRTELKQDPVSITLFTKTGKEIKLPAVSFEKGN